MQPLIGIWEPVELQIYQYMTKGLSGAKDLNGFLCDVTTLSKQKEICKTSCILISN
jgi:hypothetical protein